MTFQISISTRTALVLLVLGLLAVPATAAATHLFDDVSDSNVHSEGIQFMRNSGVSIGCKDGTVYCPDDPVTRAQMATFLYRLSGNDPATTRRSVNAGQLDGLESTDFLRVGGKAVDSDQVDGLHANQLLRVAFDQTEFATDQNGDAVSVNIEAPGPGWLITAGNIEAYGIDLDVYSCRLTVDGAPVIGTRRDSTVHFAGSGHTDNGEENCSTTGVQQVAAGSHTVALNITNWNTVTFLGASVWALYVPFDGAGQTAP